MKRTMIRAMGATAVVVLAVAAGWAVSGCNDGEELPAGGLGQGHADNGGIGVPVAPGAGEPGGAVAGDVPASAAGAIGASPGAIPVVSAGREREQQEWKKRVLHALDDTSRLNPEQQAYVAHLKLTGQYVPAAQRKLRPRPGTTEPITVGDMLDVRTQALVDCDPYDDWCEVCGYPWPTVYNVFPGPTTNGWWATGPCEYDRALWDNNGAELIVFDVNNPNTGGWGVGHMYSSAPPQMLAADLRYVLAVNPQYWYQRVRSVRHDFMYAKLYYSAAGGGSGNYNLVYGKPALVGFNGETQWLPPLAAFIKAGPTQPNP